MFSIFASLGAKIVGFVILVIISLISFIIGAFKVPNIGSLSFAKDVSGDHIDEIITRYLKFKKNRKRYSIAVTERRKDNVNN